jgi:hypothetical protein
MTSLATIQELGHRIGVQFKPQQVILFGSHAEGRAHSGSDVDLLVVMPTNRDPIDESVAIRMAGAGQKSCQEPFLFLPSTWPAGRSFPMLTMVDELTRECLAINVSSCCHD